MGEAINLVNNFKIENVMGTLQRFRNRIDKDGSIMFKIYNKKR